VVIYVKNREEQNKMSFYDIMNNGSNENAHKLLKLIGLTKESFPRYRDTSLWNNNTEIRVLTRVGGGNREEYQSNIDELKKNEYYLRDEDDNFDSTYAYIFFKVPDQYLESVKDIRTDERTIEQKTNDTLKDMENMTPEQLANHPIAKMLKQIIEDDAPSGTVYKI